MVATSRARTAGDPGAGEPPGRRAPGPSVTPALRHDRSLSSPVPGASARALVAAAIVAFVSVSAPATAAITSPASERYQTRAARRVAPGVKLLRILDRRGPNRIRVLKVDPTQRPTIDVALANGRIPGHERTTSIAARHRAVAAVNGGFTIRLPREGAGRPVHTYAEDGELIASPLVWGRNFSISEDEERAYIGHVPLRASITTRAGRRLVVRRWNRWHGKVGMFAYTPSGGELFRPPRRACSARLRPVGDRKWAADRPGVRQRYRVTRVRCSSGRLERKGGTVVSARRGTKAARTIRRSLEPGEVVRLRWALESWSGVLDTIGGNPTLLEAGRVSSGHCSGSYFCNRHPRTGIGWTSSKKVLLVTVDGRSDRSVGLTPRGFAHLFRRLGARWAINLDGGGSTTMVVRGRIVNRPADPSGQRAVGSAVLVLGGRDKGERRGRPGAARGRPSSSAASASLALFDPASTGGLLDALARGSLGPRQPLSGPLRRALDIYRSHPQRVRAVAEPGR